MNATSRRNFLKTASAATLGALAARFPDAVLAADEAKPKATADAVIVLWMGGGMAHTETFDPKRYTPFKAEMASNPGVATLPPIHTTGGNIKFRARMGK